MEAAKLTLSSGWEYRLASSNGIQIPDGAGCVGQWEDVAKMPSVVQMELLEKGIIPDPNIAENERLVQWVGNADWQYRCSFLSPSWVSHHDHVFLEFEGLDTFAQVMLNGVNILHGENMFLPYSIDISRLIKPAGHENGLHILFESALKKGRELGDRFGTRKSVDPSPMRMHVRKSQCHWGWDFGPRVLTCGPYKPITLHGFVSRIKDLDVVTVLRSDLQHASITVEVCIEGGRPGSKVTTELLNRRNKLVAAKSESIGDDERIYCTFELENPELWWPHLHGTQALYTATISLTEPAGTLLHSKSIRFGIRSIRLVQRPLDNAPGETFMFAVNGKNIFAQGGNWIPGDTMLPRVTRQDYFDWVQLAKFANHNMLRVWGGGLYESEDFYDACDEAGILVWQDFAFACGDWPLYSGFIESIKQEARAQVARLRHRASLALFCGGNEDLYFEEIFWKNKFDCKDDAGPFENTTLPQRKIFFEILPQITSELAPGIPYWANSPWKGNHSVNDPTRGDLHQWKVWHADQRPYQEYRQLSGRFVSEFGFYGYPLEQTLTQFIPDAEQRRPHSQTIDFHSKGGGQALRLGRYLSENIRYDSTKLSNYAFATQVLQSEALGGAIVDWKRKFTPGSEECAGALIWQFNDVYPGISWSYVDYYKRPKPSYYAIRRAMGPVSVGIQRKPASPFTGDLPGGEQSLTAAFFEIFAHNSNHHEVNCTLHLRAYCLRTFEWVKLPSVDKSNRVTLAPSCNNELITVATKLPQSHQFVVLEAILRHDSHDGDAPVLARVINWPQPLKYLPTQLSQACVTVSVEKQNDINALEDAEAQWEDIVTVDSNLPLKCVWLEAEGTDSLTDRPPLWEDNMFDLLPSTGGNSLRLGVKGLRNRKVMARFLGDWEH